MLPRLAIAATAEVLRKVCRTRVAGYFFLLCCLRACSLCRAPDGFDPAPIEKEGVAGDPKGTALKPWTGVPGLPKGIGPAALWPKDGVDVPKAGLSVAAAPKLKPPICGAGLLETGVPNWGRGIPAPKLNPVDAG